MTNPRRDTPREVAEKAINTAEDEQGVLCGIDLFGITIYPDFRFHNPLLPDSAGEKYAKELQDQLRRALKELIRQDRGEM
jgi:hypothetical protein